MEKLYWKGRKIQNAVLFKIKAFIKNICIIALILFLEQILVSEKCDGIFPYGLQK